MRRSAARVSLAEWSLLAALTAWGLFPLALLLIHALNAHLRLTGADGLIGADGVLGADQLQYLAWTRDAGSHGLAANLFSLTPSAHLLFEPLFMISGGLWRLGVPIQVAYLLWKPIATLALFFAALLWARRMIEHRGARVATVILALFLTAPLAAPFDWARSGSGPFRFQMYLLSSELVPATKLWGYVPSALAVALLPIALLAIERALHPPAIGRIRGAVALACGAALLASLLHPWQGITLLLIFAGLAVWERLQGWRLLLVPAAGAALPLAYYYVISHNDSAWRLAARNDALTPHLPALVLLAGLGPLLLLAAAGLRRPAGAANERLLLLWIAAIFVTYFAVNSFPPHALEGLSFPLAVLVVRGWRRLALPRIVGAVAIALATVPGLAFDARKFVNVARSPLEQYYLNPSEAHALDWVGHGAPAGGVLAPAPFSITVPSQTGRSVWVGHPYWSVDYFARARRVNSFFGGRLRPAQARRFALGSGATLVIADCAHHANLSPALAKILASVRHFGCATVYVLRR